MALLLFALKSMDVEEREWSLVVCARVQGQNRAAGKNLAIPRVACEQGFVLRGAKSNKQIRARERWNGNYGL